MAERARTYRPTDVLDRPLLSVLLTVVFRAVAPVGKSIAKILAHTRPLLEPLAASFAAQTVQLFPILVALGIPLALPSGVLRLAMPRTVLQLAGIAETFAAFRYPLPAAAVAIAVGL